MALKMLISLLNWYALVNNLGMLVAIELVQLVMNIALIGWYLIGLNDI